MVNYDFVAPLREVSYPKRGLTLWMRAIVESFKLPGEGQTHFRIAAFLRSF